MPIIFSIKVCVFGFYHSVLLYYPKPSTFTSTAELFEMFVIKLFSVISMVQFASSLHAIEDKFLTNQLMDFFTDISIDISTDIISDGMSKREAGADVLFAEKRFASLFAPINLTRANHYWTRKRGRDRETTLSWENNYTLYPTKAFKKNSVTDKDSRKKRETLKKLARLNKISSRFKREIEVKVDVTTENIPKPENKATDELPKPFNKSHEISKSGHRDKNFDRRFGRKL